MIDVSAALKNQGSIFPFEEAECYPPTDFRGEELHFDQAQLRGTFFGADETVSIDARLTVTVHAHCARCLAPVSYPMDIAFKADFRRTPDEDSYPIVGHQIDAGDAAFMALLSEMPLRFVCREDCRGLCPVCGCNRNISPCTCLEGAAGPSPFEALAVLLGDQTNEEV